MRVHPGPIYDGALASPRSLIARDEDGRAHPLPLRRWLDAADDVDARLLADVEGPVLDLGCGPGRHLRHLAAAAITAEGVDQSAAAVAIARADGLRVHRRDALDAPLRPGHWSTVLLLDGNIGIGGDPSRLLRRAAQALIPAARSSSSLPRPGAAARVAAAPRSRPRGRQLVSVGVGRRRRDRGRGVRRWSAHRAQAQ